MGIVLVLLFYAVGLGVLAVIAAPVLGIPAHLLTRGSPAEHKRSVLLAVLFPFACACFAGLWFIVYALLNSSLFHRDPMLGDTWRTPLPNGYALLMIDVTDQGTLYNPKTQDGSGSVVPGTDTAFGVRELQVAGPRIYGARDSGYSGRIGQDSSEVDTWFELDTSRGIEQDFQSYEDLQQHAASQGNALHLRDFQSVFNDYRNTWFDGFAGAVLVLVPLCGLLLLARHTWRVHQSTAKPEPAASSAAGFTS